MEPFVRPYDGVAPHVDRAAFVAPGAVVIGKVTLGPASSVWYGCILRADLERIEVGADTNIQDGCILHADPGLPIVLGDRVTLGHGAVVHGAVVEDDVMIAMRATVLNGARIGAGSVVAAGAVVLPGTEVPPGSVVAGVPGKVRKDVGDAERALITDAKDEYLRLSVAHAEQLS